MKVPLKVLIVDDEENVRITLRNILQLFHCEISEAETGNDAFQIISNTYFDLVILDNKLPGDDGIEIIKKIRKQNIKIGEIFLLTGYPEENTESATQEMRVFYFLNKKDLDLYELMEKIETVINNIRS